ncbi:hypothetical protein SAMN04487820_107224 [Actinopolyspora mzabensis]|uniref:Uncharacterized protein n=1 Tax=Actinopolyspora mzabensis TaxID=995066 RepID=A0A1G9BLC7_ACTMZ|nr:Rv2175c family DNA-binding protein [Actinopolyspora mzabensis]SDK40291.1 hypothetical protein SAMN04487820_107224 [Actinopolyspora mzabensis]
MSSVPSAPDVLSTEVDVVSISAVAERLGYPLTRVHQLIRDGQLVAMRRERELVIPEAFLTMGSVVKGLPGTITLLRDNGYTEDEILEWLFTPDETLPGTPIDALRGDRGREVKRRAQAMAL